MLLFHSGTYLDLIPQIDRPFAGSSGIDRRRLLDDSVSLAGVVGGDIVGCELIAHYHHPHVVGDLILMTPAHIWVMVLDPIDASPDIPPLERVKWFWGQYDLVEVRDILVVE